MAAMWLAQTPDQPTLLDSRWFIDPGGESGALRKSATRDELVRTYGIRNVKDGDMDVGEGETTPATFLFPDDPSKTIAIAWRDAKTKRFPMRIQIDGAKSLWHTTGDVSLGTSLKTLERLNQKPFVLFGFNWDYSGTVASWENGAFEDAFGGADRRVIVRLSPDRQHKVPEDLLRKVIGDRDFHSSDPAMRQINPLVYQLIWNFPER
jgi:hypothetical protein